MASAELLQITLENRPEIWDSFILVSTGTVNHVNHIEGFNITMLQLCNNNSFFINFQGYFPKNRGPIPHLPSKPLWSHDFHQEKEASHGTADKA